MKNTITHKAGIKFILVLILLISLSACEKEKEVKEVTGSAEKTDVTFNENVVFTDATETDIDVTNVDSTSYDRKVYSLDVKGDKSLIKKGNIVIDTSGNGKENNIWIIVEEEDNKKSTVVGKAIEGALDCIYDVADITLTTKSNRAKESSSYPGKMESNKSNINYKDINIIKGNSPQFVNQEITIPYENEVLYDRDGITITIESGSIKFQPSFDLFMKFRPEQAATSISAGVATVTILRSSIKDFHSIIYSNLDFNLKTNINISGNASIVDKKIKLFTFYTNIPAAPVDISIATSVIARLTVDAEGSINMTPHFISKNNFVTAVKYGDFFEAPEIYTNSENIDRKMENNIKGEANLTQRLEIVPQIDVYLYGVFGPSAELIPYEQFYASVSTTGSWYNNLSLGLDGNAGIDISAFHIDMATISIYSEEFNILDYTIYEAPAELSIISGNNQTGNSYSQLSNPLVVNATDNLGNTLENYPVNWDVISGGGSLANNIVNTSQNGEASNTWTLGGSETQETKAAIKKPDGSEIDNVTFTATTSGQSSTDVYNSTTGKVWMDRNLGASQVATSSTDAAAYGDLYQWGRAADGHESRTSNTTATLAISDTPGHGDFITSGSSPYDWRNPQNDNLWQGVSGTNNPCPSGYRLPTKAEWEAERTSWSSDNAAGAFASPLKLPVAGHRGSSNGSLYNVGSLGRYWSSTVDGTNSRYLYVDGSGAGMYSYRRASGYSVRCLKD